MAWAAAAILFCAWTLPFAELTDTSVTCTFSEDCVLPCTFKASSDEVIHWNRNKLSVHAYYRAADHLDKQDKHFKGRTSLFKDQIKHGNASLLLRNCNIQDSGKYQCYTSTKQGNQEKLINMKVHAPIRSVNIEKIDEEVICSSKGIYPAPNLSWTTDPPTQSDMLNNSTQTTQDPNGLYSVQSKVRFMGNVSNCTYICSVTSADGMQKWTTSLKQQEMSSVNGANVTIPCLAPGIFKPRAFTWTITRAHKAEVILRQFDNLTQEISDHWKNKARVDPKQVLSGNGSLWLQNILENSAQTETYTCAFAAFRIQHLVLTDVTLLPEPHTGDQRNRVHYAAILPGALIIAAMCALMVLKKKSKQRDTPGPEAQQKPTLLTSPNSNGR
ncbi:hypothetical protein COCON_G00084490 [Conger conger]|uniref:Ig-like domain-containing protein n=1 Tax=Conger conger TaxID=82655 RepID=A0A9Q1I2Y0_CONCO|nr:hypothetical protein COCON_G00084490 [Conger conger]